MRFTPRQQILWSYPGEARPVTVIADDADGLAVWLPPGTQILASVHLDGSEFRSQPLEQRFLSERKYELRAWRGSGIVMLAPPGAAHSCWLFRNEDGGFLGWYGNLEEPLERAPWGVHTRDHVLDVWLDADGVVHWKDEDELAEVVKIGRFTPEAAAEIRAEGERVHAAMTRGDPPFDGRSWLDWQPDPSWPIPTLPEGLRALVGRPRTGNAVLDVLGG